MSERLQKSPRLLRLAKRIDNHAHWLLDSTHPSKLPFTEASDGNRSGQPIEADQRVDAVAEREPQEFEE